jgi:hypothetical protein
VVCTHSPRSGWLASAYWAFRSQLQRSALSWRLRGGFSQTGSSRGRLSRWDYSLIMMFGAHLYCRPPRPLRRPEPDRRSGKIRSF